MKKITIYLMVSLFALTSIACISQQNEKEEETENTIKTELIEVYYFHFTRRCVTCNAVESVTQEALQEYFADDMKNAKIIFKSINLDEETNKELATKLGVSGQALLFVAGDNKINLTNDGFMYAKSTPQKLKAKVKVTIDKLK